MMVVLPVPGEICRECGLCCRFSDPEVLTPWAIRNPEKGRLPALFEGSRPIHLSWGEGRMGLSSWICSGLDSKEYRCSLWGGHPADCRLYPLLLVRRSGVFTLVLDTDCPFSSRADPSFFVRWACKFRDEEWSSLTERDLQKIAPLADQEDRPHYTAVLSLPSPPSPVP